MPSTVTFGARLNGDVRRLPIMVNLQRFSKKAGLFKKDHAFAAIVTFSDAGTPEQDFAAFREGFLAWAREVGASGKDLLFTFMARDEDQSRVFAFFRSLLADAELCSRLATIQLKLQFPKMTQAIADQTHARIYAKDV